MRNRAYVVRIFQTSLSIWLGLFVTFAAMSIAPLNAQERAAPASSDIPAIKTLNAPNITKDEFVLRIIHLSERQLAQLADRWLALTQQQTRDAASVNIELSKAPQAEHDRLQKRLSEALKERNRQLRRLGLIIEEWEAKGGKPEDITQYKKYASAVLRSELEVTELETILAYFRRWLTSPDGGLRLARLLLSVLLWFAALYTIALLLARALRRRLRNERRMSSLLRNFLSRVAFWVFILLGGLSVLSLHGVDLTPLLAAFGGASFIAAFALQDTLGNLASGLMIMIYRPFDEGDYVDVGGTDGTVKSVSIVATTIATPDNKIIVIPNKNIWGGTITNLTATDTRRVDLVFGISYNDNIEDAVQKIAEVLASHPLVLKRPEPIICVDSLEASSVNIICRPWVDTSDYWKVYWDLIRKIKETLDDAGISIPYPQLEVHVKAAPNNLSSATPA